MTTPRTSHSHPIRIDWLRGLAHGRLGITFAPGKHSTSSKGGTWRRDLLKDLDDLVAAGVTDLACLLQDEDLESLRITRLIAEATARGLRVHRLPIVDRSVPGSRPELIELLAALQERLAAGGSVVIHCEGGKGRAGLVTGCLLASLGASGQEALQRLQAARGEGCPETPQQRAFVERFAAEARPWMPWTLVEPITLGALTVFPIRCTTAPTPALLTLETALECGLAVVREAEGFSQVTLDNLGDLPVLCLAGDLVKGGMQDRILRHDTVLAPHQTGLVVEAFCVEAGRWGTRPGEASDRFGTALYMAPTQLRRHLMTGSDQGEVWEEVARTQERLGRTQGRALRDARSASSLGLSLSLPELRDQVARQLDHFVGMTRGCSTGYLAHIEGVGWHLEWFSSHAMFLDLQPRLLRALVTAALGASPEGRAPGMAEAERWLAAASLLHSSPKVQAGLATRHHRDREGVTMSLTRWPGRQVLHGVVVG